ncbi:glycosyltransferase family 2 protein [Novosphingobium album (ex Hu et al. 2023)]|uniref:Glycosyltransferase n=1 Tax=Novosphingobium album (ex Hu et al. 2023) TaxID=2930093 RepID=A0ABT0B6D3_9SPHN|nr:glycosyltransferase [Novosphingobium album (ex Hu et al. 2023)]MCJ2180610.1 glycosyltransferase [Novosphingobium album (ex Hu et al. 2023)]
MAREIGNGMKNTLMVKLGRASRRQAMDCRARGDEARDSRAWAVAADHYEAYLVHNPEDFGIRVQLGHMRKEAGALQAAEAAYAQALKLRPDDADLLLNLGHLSKLQGRLEDAARYYVKSARQVRGGYAMAELRGGWLPEDVRQRFMQELDTRDAATEKALQRVTKGARVSEGWGLHSDRATGGVVFGFDPRIKLELSAEVRAAPVAVIEIEFDRVGAFSCPAGVLYLDTGKGFREEDRLDVIYPEGERCSLTLFLAAPAAIRQVRWDPTELPQGGISIKRIEVSGISDLDMLVERVSAEDVVWTYDYNRTAPEEMRRCFGAFFAHSPLTADDFAVLQGFLPTSSDRGRDYAHWCFRYANPGVEEYERMKVMIGEMTWRPTFSFVMPVYNTPPHLLREVLDAMLGQNYPDFEICIADDCSSKAEVAKILREYADRYPAVRWVRRTLNGHISAASNSALDLASGDFVVLVDHDDLIPPYALFVVAAYINRFPDAKILFSDEDKISLTGERFDPYFKSAYNEYLMFGHNMVSHLGIYDRQLLTDVGGFRMGLEGSQDYDLFLRASERIDPAQIIHIPHVLYHWRQVPGSTAISANQKDYAELAARNSINGHFERTRMPLQSVAGHAPGNSAITPRREYATPVSIIIPTRNGLELLRSCIDSIVERCPANVEILIADNDSDDAATLAFLEEAPSLYKQVQLRVARTPGPFNFSAINNQAAAAATGEILCFLNNDTEVLAPGWIDRARGLLAMDDVGAVGGKLLYPDGAIQHFGLVTGMYGHRVAGGVHLFQPADGYGYFSKPCMIQEFSAATAACLFVSKDMFDAVGGFEEELAVAYNDVDLCLKVRRIGKRVLCDPSIRLLHKESRSRGSDASKIKRERLDREAEWMRRRWGKTLDEDPFFSPNHSLDRPDFALAYPPRQQWPWELGDTDAPRVAPGKMARAPQYFGRRERPGCGFLAVCAIMKNEATNIVEWLAYHHALGVEKFYLYDNRSTDHVGELLQPLVAQGIVEIIPWPINPGQLEAYDDFADRYGANWTWTAFIDADEFINPYGFESITSFLGGFEDASAVAVQWMNYGPNGHDTPPSGLLIEAYTKRFEDFNPIHQHVKTIVRMGDYVRARSPHSFWVNGRVVDEYNQEIDVNAGDYAIMPIRAHTGICLNHYYTRSRAEWYAKVARGMADSAANAPNRRDPAWIEAYEREALSEDHTITRFSAMTREVITNWGYAEGPSLSPVD